MDKASALSFFNKPKEKQMAKKKLSHLELLKSKQIEIINFEDLK